VIDDRLTRLASAPISPTARAMLTVLARVTQDHEALEPGDFAELRELGVGDEAIIDALNVAYLFNIINRMADALRFEIGPPASFVAAAKILLGRGYR
jgi:alkylhydroperoxidase family enzyme